MAKWIRPTLDTKYHIDFDWWDEQKLDFRLYLRSQLCEDHQKDYAAHQVTELVDWVDPNTAEVKRVDALWQALKSCCSLRDDYISESTPLITAVFRMFLLNDNTPLSPRELAEKIGHARPDTILRTLSKGKIYRGIKPVTTAE
jgi:hypothetical protein